MIKLKRIQQSVWLLLLAASFNAHAKLNVFACEPEWKALVEELGGDKVKAFSATNAFQDPHHIEARPSLIAKMRRSDLLICTGSELEIGWLPLLVRQSGNKKIQTDQAAYFLASELVERIDIPDELDRSLGDIHAGGNPHVHLDPYRLLTIATELTKRLQGIDPSQEEYYQQRLQDFTQRWQTATKNWETKAAPLQGKQAVVYHANWNYLTNWLKFENIADLEPKPGLPPTSSHLVSLLKTVTAKKPDFILVANYQDSKGAKWLASKSGVPVVNLPFTVGGNKESTDLFSLYESTINLLLNAK